MHASLDIIPGALSQRQVDGAVWLLSSRIRFELNRPLAEQNRETRARAESFRAQMAVFNEKGLAVCKANELGPNDFFTSNRPVRRQCSRCRLGIEDSPARAARPGDGDHAAGQPVSIWSVSAIGMGCKPGASPSPCAATYSNREVEMSDDYEAEKVRRIEELDRQIAIREASLAYDVPPSMLEQGRTAEDIARLAAEALEWRGTGTPAPQADRQTSPYSGSINGVAQVNRGVLQYLSADQINQLRREGRLVAEGIGVDQHDQPQRNGKPW